mgnify:FL=1
MTLNELWQDIKEINWAEMAALVCFIYAAMLI